MSRPAPQQHPDYPWLIIDVDELRCERCDTYEHLNQHHRFARMRQIAEFDSYHKGCEVAS